MSVVSLMVPMVSLTCLEKFSLKKFGPCYDGSTLFFNTLMPVPKYILGKNVLNLKMYADLIV